MIELKGEMDKCRIIVSDFSIPLSTIGRTKTETQQRYRTKHSNQQDLKDIYILPNNSKIDVLFKLPFDTQDSMVGHETHLNILTGIEVMRICSLTTCKQKLIIESSVSKCMESKQYIFKYS